MKSQIEKDNQKWIVTQKLPVENRVKTPFGSVFKNKNSRNIQNTRRIIYYLLVIPKENVFWKIQKHLFVFPQKYVIIFQQRCKQFFYVFAFSRKTDPKTKKSRKKNSDSILQINIVDLSCISLTYSFNKTNPINVPSSYQP